MKTLSIFFITICCVSFSFAQIVTIPDVNFKAALLMHDPVVDTNSDGEIQVSEAEAMNMSLNLGDKNISDLTGIEAFINIISLNVSDNFLTSLDLSANTDLQSLTAWSNLLTELNVTQNTALTQLELNTNDLTSLDVTNNVNLIYIGIGYNEIGDIDLSQNVNLMDFSTLQNPHTFLDFSNNPNMRFVGASGNDLLQHINIQNGNTIGITNLYLWALDALECVKVDSDMLGNIPDTWTYPEGTNFSDSCVMDIDDVAEIELEIYPNPTRQEFHIRSTEPVKSVQVYAVSGQKVRELNEQMIQKVNVSDLPKGIYLIRVITNSNKVFTQKLIVK